MLPVIDEHDECKWYRLTWVVPHKIQSAVKWLWCCDSLCTSCFVHDAMFHKMCVMLPHVHL